MQIQRRVLYNSLRQNWLLDPELDVAEWQVEDYRALESEELFSRLADQDIHLDREALLAYADECESPEDLADHLLLDRDELDAGSQDQIYLAVFELWRRMLPERLCLSVFCDEVDHQINLYDSGEIERPETIPDVLANLQEVLDENADQGGDPKDVFKVVSEGCANGLETFLYDFVSDQLDEGVVPYAAELVDGFYQYVADTKWFDFLRARIAVETDPVVANALFANLITEVAEEPDLEFCLEVLAYMVPGGERNLFVSLVKQVLPWIDGEDDFQELLSICVDFYQRLDYEWEEKALQDILDAREKHDLEKSVHSSDPHRQDLIRIIEKRKT